MGTEPDLRGVRSPVAGQEVLLVRLAEQDAWHWSAPFAVQWWKPSSRLIRGEPQLEYDNDNVLTRYVWNHFSDRMTDFEREVGNAIIGREKAARA